MWRDKDAHPNARGIRNKRGRPFLSINLSFISFTLSAEREMSGPHSWIFRVIWFSFSLPPALSLWDLHYIRDVSPACWCTEAPFNSALTVLQRDVREFTISEKFSKNSHFFKRGEFQIFEKKISRGFLINTFHHNFSVTIFLDKKRKENSKYFKFIHHPWQCGRNKNSIDSSLSARMINSIALKVGST